LFIFFSIRNLPLFFSLLAFFEKLEFKKLSLFLPQLPKHVEMDFWKTFNRESKPTMFSEEKPNSL